MSEPAPPYHRELVERGSHYAIFLIFLEMPGAHHRGFVVERGTIVVPKGLIAGHVRSLSLENVEMVVAPPADSNAILMVRVRGDEAEATIDRVAREALGYLRSQGFFSPADEPPSSGRPT